MGPVVGLEHERVLGARVEFVARPRGLVGSEPAASAVETVHFRPCRRGVVAGRVRVNFTLWKQQQREMSC